MGVVKGGVERVSHREAQVVLVQGDQRRTQGSRVTQADGKVVRLILKPPNHLSH